MSDRGMEVKKVKRDADASGGVEELGVNGRVGIVSPESSLPLQREYSSVTKPSQVQSTTLPQPQTSPAGLQSSSQECSSSEGKRSTPASSSAETFITTSCSSPGPESVESLIDELLEQAPSEPLSEDANGQGISIEAFHQELRELEERVKGRRVPKRSTDEFIQDPLSNPADPNRPDEECPSLETEQGTEESKPESSTPAMFSPARPLGQPQAQPYIGNRLRFLYIYIYIHINRSTGIKPIFLGVHFASAGPFLTVLFSKLENMVQNSLYVNVLLTGIVFQLACYPQPLLRSFLLNTNMVFQPSVKSLIQVGLHWTPEPMQLYSITKRLIQTSDTVPVRHVSPDCALLRNAPKDALISARKHPNS